MPSENIHPSKRHATFALEWAVLSLVGGRLQLVPVSELALTLKAGVSVRWLNIAVVLEMRQALMDVLFPLGFEGTETR